MLSQLLGEPGTGGSSTPSMVGAVKKWQKADPKKSQETWRKLAEANSELEKQLDMLSKLAKEHWDAYKCVIDSCSRLKPEKVCSQTTPLALKKTTIKYNFLVTLLLKKMNILSFWIALIARKKLNICHTNYSE